MPSNGTNASVIVSVLGYTLHEVSNSARCRAVPRHTVSLEVLAIA